jgi:hypothetical protein
MILFKRVGESFRHIEDREWVLLFLETLGVLVGILLAFELQEWASRRAESSRRHDLLERLFVESEDTISALLHERNLLANSLAKERAFATTLVHDGKCPPAPMWDAVTTVGLYPAFRVPSSAYDEMMGSGGLSMIDDERARHAIGDFRAWLAWSERQNDYYRQNLTIPYSEDEAGVTVDYVNGADEPEVVNFDRSLLCVSRPFRNKVASAVASHRKAVSLRDRLLKKATEMCTVIGQSLGRRCTPPADRDPDAEVIPVPVHGS